MKYWQEHTKLALWRSVDRADTPTEEQAIHIVGKARSSCVAVKAENCFDRIDHPWNPKRKVSLAEALRTQRHGSSLTQHVMRTEKIIKNHDILIKKSSGNK
jgi:hypothetical protein